MDYGGASKNAKSKQGSARQANQSYNYYDACQISRCKTDMSRDLDEVFPNAIKPFLDPGRSDLGSDCCTLTLLPKGRRKPPLETPVAAGRSRRNGEAGKA